MLSQGRKDVLVWRRERLSQRSRFTECPGQGTIEPQEERKQSTSDAEHLFCITATTTIKIWKSFQCHQMLHIIYLWMPVLPSLRKCPVKTLHHIWLLVPGHMNHIGIWTHLFGWTRILCSWQTPLQRPGVVEMSKICLRRVQFPKHNRFAELVHGVYEACSPWAHLLLYFVGVGEDRISDRVCGNRGSWEHLWTNQLKWEEGVYPRKNELHLIAAQSKLWCRSDMARHPFNNMTEHRLHFWRTDLVSESLPQSRI